MILYPHQVEAIQKARQGSLALFHKPGSGKTLTTLKIFEGLRAINPELKMLVICPLSLINHTWCEEIRTYTKFTYWVPKKHRTKEYDYTDEKSPDIFITNYELFMSKYGDDFINTQLNLLHNKFMVALDESSRLKNHKSLTTKKLLKLRDKFVHRFILSGTPSPNSELELWGQIRFISDALPKSFFEFRNRFFQLARGGKTMQVIGFIPAKTMQQLMMTGWKYQITDEKRKELMRLIEPYCHFAEKPEGLPAKIDKIIDVYLSDKEKRIYKEMKNQLIAELNGQEITAPVALTKLMKLRQITSGFLYNEHREALPIEDKSSKIKALFELLETVDGQAIIWIQFKEEVKQLLKYIPDAVTLYSETEDRNESISKFKSGEVKYLIAHPESAAHGLTLVNCHNEIFYSWDYSFENNEQAKDRIHRPGQTETCTYYFLCAQGTIDEEMLKVLHKKQDLQNAVREVLK